MIQSVQLQKARVPALALAALGLVALGATAQARLSTSAPAPQAIVDQAPMTTLAQRPIVQPQTDSTTCGAGAYVSGDVAGDTSPTEIYAAMCGARP